MLLLSRLTLCQSWFPHEESILSEEQVHDEGLTEDNGTESGNTTWRASVQVKTLQMNLKNISFKDEQYS